MLEQKKCLEDNRVIVRVWTSLMNKTIKGESVGHVSIETATPKGYMSLWPKKTSTEKQLSGLWKPINYELKAEYKADLETENRSPEIMVCLYSLNAPLISDAFAKVISDPDFKGWTLIGDNRSINQGTGHSCASLAYDLLKAGGIYELIASTYSSNFSSVVTPDELGATVKKAKQSELEQYPETQNFRYENETKVGVSKPTFCCIL